MSKRSPTCERVNSEEYSAIWRDYHARLHSAYGKETPWETWNDRIVDNIIALCETNKGKTIAVVFGSAHAYYFVDRLAGRDGVRLVAASTFFPLSDDEVAAWMQPVDYLRALRRLNFPRGSVDARSLHRMEGILEKAESHKELEHDCRLFRGKLLRHRRRPEQALRLFQSLTDLKLDVISAFDGTTPIAEAAMVLAAITKNDLGRRAEARADLEAIRGDRRLTPATRQWAGQLLATMESE